MSHTWDVPPQQMTSDGASQQSLFLCIASPYIPSSLLPPPQRSTGPSSSLFSIFLPLYYSLHTHLYFYPPSVPYSPCLPHPWAFRSTPAIEISFKLYLLVLSVPLSFRTHRSLRRFCPFTNLVSRPRHHVGPGSSPASRQTFLSSFLLSVLTLFHLTWLFIHWCSDAKVMNSQQNAVCFNWCTLETLQEATCGGGRNSLIFLSLYAAYLDECQWSFSVFPSVIVLTSLWVLEWKASTAQPRAENCMM